MRAGVSLCSASVGRKEARNRRDVDRVPSGAYVTVTDELQETNEIVLPSSSPEARATDSQSLCSLMAGPRGSRRWFVGVLGWLACCSVVGQWRITWEDQGGKFPDMDAGGRRAALCSLQSHSVAPTSPLVSVVTTVNHSPPAEEFLWLEALATRLLTFCF